jgi:hypothetical protein
MMKSKSTKYAHQSSRSPNLDIPNPNKIGEKYSGSNQRTNLVLMSHRLVVRMWRRNHLPLTARIRHSYHELLQIYIAEVKSLCGV